MGPERPGSFNQEDERGPSPERLVSGAEPPSPSGGEPENQKARQDPRPMPHASITEREEDGNSGTS